MKKLMSQTAESYRLAAVFLVAAFPLVCLPIFFEGLQHIAEVRLGMFAGEGSSELSETAQAIRLSFGALKVISIIATTVFVTRFFLHGKNVRRALQFSATAKKAILVGCLVMVVAMVLAFLVGPAFLRFLKPDISAAKAMLIPFLLLLFAGFPLQNKINGWMAYVFDDTPLSDMQNKSLNKAMKGGFSAVILATFLPTMVLHYFLNMQAMGGTAAQLWVLLTLDSFVVGVLACLLGASYYVVYRDGRR
jgi:hypothetical protein